MNLFFDIGGTKFRIAQAEQNQEAFDFEPLIYDTPKKYSDFLKFIEELPVLQNNFYEKIIIGIPGAFNYYENKLGQVVNLPDWSEKKLISDLEKIIKHKTIKVYNDTELVAYGEVFYGAGKNLNNNKIAYLTISTGVNAFLVNKNNNLQNDFQTEIGHMIIDKSNNKTWEDTVGGKSMAEEFNCHILDIPSLVWKERAKDVAIGIYNFNLFWQPETTIIGGSMITKEIGFKIKDIEKELSYLKQIYHQKPNLIQASLGGTGGLYGGLYISNLKT